MASQQPSTTLYITNLDTKLKKQDLRRVLYMLFSTHGKVLDVVAKKGSMRGQAHVVFQDLQSATAAMRRESGKELCGRTLRITYAKSKSHATVLAEDGPEVLFRLQKGITDAKMPKLVVSGAEKKNIDAKKNEKRALEVGEGEEDADAEGSNKRPKINGVDEDEDEAAMEEDSDEETKPAQANGRIPPRAAPQAPPHNLLLVSDIPFEVTTEMLDVLFKQHNGLQNIRYNPHRNGGTAQVHYETIAQAREALEAQNGFQVAPSRYISVAYSSR